MAKKVKPEVVKSNEFKPVEFYFVGYHIKTLCNESYDITFAISDSPQEFKKRLKPLLDPHVNRICLVSIVEKEYIQQKHLAYSHTHSNNISSDNDHMLDARTPFDDRYVSNFNDYYKNILNDRDKTLE